MPSAIVTHGLSRSFGQVRALDGLDIEVPAGIVFGFLGPNGAGKTTALRLLLGLITPTSGSAEVLGFDTRTRGDDIRARSSALLEHSGLYERLTAYENLEFFGRVWRLGAAQRRERVRELLVQIGLWDRRNDIVATWSRGMKQKLAIARVLLHKPELIFLDEPTAGLDPVAAATLREDLAALVAREGTTVFLTTHNLNEAERLCARIAVLRAGKLLAIGHPDELRASASTDRVELVVRGWTETIAQQVRSIESVQAIAAQNGRIVVNLRPGASAAPLVRTIVEAGADVEEVRRGTALLEDVFLSLVEGEDA